MDTNNLDMNGLPSAEELQRLANDYFNAPPSAGMGFSPGQFEDPTAIHSQLQGQRLGWDVNQHFLEGIDGSSLE